MMQTDTALKKIAPYGGILLLIVLLYTFTLRFPVEFHKTHVVQGDYTITWFHSLALAHQAYWKTLWITISSHFSWYQLQVALVSLLSPFIYKDPDSVSLINFFALFIATGMFYRLANVLFKDSSKALFCALLYWLFPAHYGHQAIALYSLGQDPTFFNFFCAGICSLLIYAFRPEQMKHAFLAAMFIGVSSWGRGNSIPYILLAGCVPGAFIIKSLICARTSPFFYKKLVSFAVFLSVASFLCVVYLVAYYPVIQTYYFHHQEIAKEAPLVWNKVYSLFVNFPGLYFTSYHYSESPQHSFSTIVFSVLSHLLVAGAGWYVCKFSRWRELKILALTGMCAYYATFVVIAFYMHNVIVSGSGFIMVVQSFYPMLLGLYFIVLACCVQYLNKRQFFAPSILILSLVLFVFGFHWTKKSFPNKASENPPFPDQMNELACNITRHFPDSAIAFLWHGVINQSSINYYRLLNGLPLIEHAQHAPDRPHYYHDENWGRLWIPSEVVDQKLLQDELHTVFSHADVVIMPEQLMSYEMCGDPYPLYHNTELLPAVYDSPNTPPFAVRMKLRDGATNLLVLQRCDPDDRDRLPKGFFKSPHLP